MDSEEWLSDNFCGEWIIKVILKIYLPDNEKVRYIKDARFTIYHKNCHTTWRIKFF
jgi:hypothetical protein